MGKLLFAVFGIFAYSIFFATFLYLIAFLANVPGVPRTIDIGMSSGIVPATLTNLALIALFGVQHSVMARQGFKRLWTLFIPDPIERSTYVLMSSIVLWVMFHFWLPIPFVIWNVTNPVGAGVLWAIFGLGWLIVLLSTFLINHFELFGLKQVYQHMRGGASVDPQFRTPLFYKLVRHPLYTGFLIAFWATPTMTVGHLLFSAGMTVYILIAIQYEERDLVGLFGDTYQDYQKNVGKLTPKIGS